MKKQSEILQKELKDFIDMYGMDNMFLKGRIEEAKLWEAKSEKIKEIKICLFMSKAEYIEEIDKIIEGGE